MRRLWPLGEGLRATIRRLDHAAAWINSILMRWTSSCSAASWAPARGGYNGDKFTQQSAACAGSAAAEALVVVTTVRNSTSRSAISARRRWDVAGASNSPSRLAVMSATAWARVRTGSCKPRRAPRTQRTFDARIVSPPALKDSLIASAIIRVMVRAIVTRQKMCVSPKSMRPAGGD